MGGRAKAEDRAQADLDVRGEKRRDETVDDDRMGSLATSEENRGSLDAALRTIEHRFLWFNSAAQDELDKLKGDISKKDEPDWVEHLALSLLGVALGGAAAGAGAFLASKLASNAGKGAEALVSSLFSDGIKAGVSAGASKLAGGNDDNVADKFIEAHKEGVWVAQMRNQTTFIKRARSEITTPDQAKAVEDALSEANIKAAAKEQYAASRDAWVTYLAQARLGVVGKFGRPVGRHRATLDEVPTSTNMATHEQRRKQHQGWEQSNHGQDNELDVIPYAEPGANVPGVLSVFVDLPEIKNGKMNGAPTIQWAILGVNDAIRKQYENVPLSEMRIPRQINANVAGAPDFTINLDENGHFNQIEEKRRLWLTQRATASRADVESVYAQDQENHVAKANADKPKNEQMYEGLQLLLKELVPSKIKKSII